MMQGMIQGDAPGRNQALAMRVNALVQIAHGISTDRSESGRATGDLRVTLGQVRDGTYERSLSFANGDYTLAYEVVRGDVDLATINPSGYLTMAYRGTGLFEKPLPVRVIAVMPTWDRMFFAVAEGTGLKSIADIKEQKYPLHVSIRRSQAHGTRFVIDELFAAHGFSLADLESWGGRFHYTDAPNEPGRLEMIRSGSLDAVFDEGVKGWGYVALDHGMKVLDLDEVSLGRLSQLGWPVGPSHSYFPKLDREITAVSFGGWPLFTRADLPDRVAYQMAESLAKARDRITFDWDSAVELSELCEGTDAAPRDVPLHPGAERFYREQGCSV